MNEANEKRLVEGVEQIAALLAKLVEAVDRNAVALEELGGGFTGLAIRIEELQSGIGSIWGVKFPKRDGGT